MKLSLLLPSLALLAPHLATALDLGVDKTVGPLDTPLASFEGSLDAGAHQDLPALPLDGVAKGADSDLEKRCDSCDDNEDGQGGGGYDFQADFCPRRFHRNRFGRCVRNGGRGGCRWGYRRSRWGFCIPDRDDWEDDDWRGGPNDGNCPRDFTPNGSGTDGFSFDFDGNGPPEGIPDGWAFFGESISWAPFAGWEPSPGWRPPTVFIKIWVRVTWWSPPTPWRDHWQTRDWTFGSCPDFWGWQPRGRGGRGGRGRRPVKVVRHHGRPTDASQA